MRFLDNNHVNLANEVLPKHPYEFQMLSKESRAKICVIIYHKCYVNVIEGDMPLLS